MPKGKIRKLIKDRLRHKSPDNRGLEVPVERSSQHSSLDITGTRPSADRSRQHSTEMSRSTATATVTATDRDCRQALSGWTSRFNELSRHVEQGSPTAMALDSARAVVGELSYSDLLDEGNNEVFEAVVNTRRDFDERYEETIENIGRGNSREERPEAANKVIINTQDIVNMVLGLVRQLPPRLQPEQMQNKVKDLKEKAKKLDKAVSDSYAAGHLYNMRNSGSGQQNVLSGSGTQNNSTGHGSIFSGQQSRGTYNIGPSGLPSPPAASPEESRETRESRESSNSG
ncbi:hypothetical protein QBC32DRAFT_353713 [Pseudoneurospora amorphoporcata]|uniref:Uncharacterized protein n=1 Tax=Pseudoneurospora amorphoporcata TaxID=241081 RepID=A0AAN6SC82_9PEZI|nr:hypothetical protein QBC32DRAFT_353713 [Pseudoneurospora amorphoporcata]